MSKEGKARKRAAYWDRKIREIFKPGGLYDQIRKGK